MKTALALFLFLFPTAASAAERGYSVTDFDRIRIDGPYSVQLVTGRSPSARATGSQGAIEAVSVEVQGRTLIVRRNSQAWGGSQGATGKPTGPVTLQLSTQSLRGATVNGAGSLGIDKLRGATIDLVVSGSGSMTVEAIDADKLTVAVVGNGRATVAGRVAIAQVGVRGTGGFDGEKLIAKEAKLGADGPADIRITATTTAGVVSNGAGTIVVLGDPACTVKATGSGSVVCGKAR